MVSLFRPWSNVQMIKYSLLVLGWTAFWLHSSWHSFNRVLETFLRHEHDMITQLLQIWISLFTTSQRCSVRLGSGECGCHLSTANTSHVRETSEMIKSFWYVVLSYWKEPSEVGYTVLIKRWTWSTVFRQMCKQMLQQKQSPETGWWVVEATWKFPLELWHQQRIFSQ